MAEPRPGRVRAPPPRAPEDARYATPPAKTSPETHDPTDDIGGPPPYP